MKPLALFTLLLVPLSGSAQTEKAAEVRLAPAPGMSGSIGVAPAPLSLTVPNLAAAALAPAPAAGFTLNAAPALQAAPAPALTAASARETAMLPAAIPVMRAAPVSAGAERTPGARGDLQEGGRIFAAPTADGGKIFFDGGAGHAVSALVSGGAASDGPRLARPAGRADKPAPAIPLKQRAGEIAELGVLSLGFQLAAGIGFLILGAHASFPLVAGAFWVFAGSQLIGSLGGLRAKIVGGWQASHDQKMRHDYGTGQLRDIRGRKYGSDRYDEWAPGPVSARERWTVDAAAFVLGLPWVVPAGPKAVALYAAGAAAALGLRRLWRARRAAEKTADPDSHFEYDR